MSLKCGENGVSATKLSFWDVFSGFSAYYCIRKLKASYFQLSTLIWLVGLSLVTLSHHTRLPLWCTCLPGSRSGPGLDLTRGRVWCLKCQWMQYSKQGGGGRRNPAEIFKCLLKSILGVFFIVVVKCQFILMKLTG